MTSAGDIVVCAPLRTAVGRFGGMFRNVDAATLAATVIKAIIKQTGIDPHSIDEVILGQASPNGEAPAIGRVAALESGLGFGVVGRQVDRRCGSGLQAIIDAALQIRAGVSDLVIAGGTENMSQAEHYALGTRWGRSGQIGLEDRLERARITAGGRNHLIPGGTLETAENLRQKYGILRIDQDEMALLSHQKAVAAQKAELFREEIVPVEVAARGEKKAVLQDEHPRPETTMEALAALRPVRLQQDPSSTVTAGNSSGQNDGAAACIVTTLARANELGLQPLAKLVSWGVAGVEPELMGIAAAPATEAALKRAGISLKDVDIVELNEAFAAQALAVLKVWGISMHDSRLNPRGSGISLGHPVGATGARIVATLLHTMSQQRKRYGLATMCIAGGQGLAAIFKRVGK